MSLGLTPPARRSILAEVRRIALIAMVMVACGSGSGSCSRNGPSLSQIQQLTVVLSPTTKDFGSVEVGQMSPYATITVNPSLGNQDDFVTDVYESCPDFVVSAPGLPAHVYRVCEYQEPCELCANQVLCMTIEYQSYQFQAAYSPTVPGSVSCVVNVELNNTTLRTMTLTGTGTVPPKDIDVQPAQVNFGDVRNNTASTPVGLTVRNAGGTAMTVSSVGVSAGYAITAGQMTQYPLNPGASMGYSVTCNPTATGGLAGSFVVQSDDPVTPTVTVPLQCNGIDSNVAITPSPTTLATTRVGEPVQTTVQIANTGAASMALQGVSVTGTDLTLISAPGNGTYGTGSVGSAVVRFGAAAKGTQAGVLTVTYDGGQTRTTQISARALATSMALTPDGDVDFGPVCAGQSRAQSFSILANEEGAFQVTQLGGLTPPFTMMAPNLPASVQGSGATMLQFMVTAAPTVAGIQTAELNLATNIPASAPRTINLSVDALAAGVSPSPVALDFGSAPAMTTTIGQPVHLSNCSTTPATFTNARIEGADATEFAIVATPEGAAVPANGTATWLIVLSTDEPGLKHAEFAVDHEGGTARVPLDGESLGDDVIIDPTDPGEELSYYSCSAGGSPSRVWPFLLALGIVLRRRRRRR